MTKLTPSVAAILAATSDYEAPKVGNTFGQIIKLIQKENPELNPRNSEKYVPNLKTGDFLLPGHVPLFYPGEEGFVFQPAALIDKWVHWPPEGADNRPEHYDAKPLEADGDMMPDGGQIVFTRYLVAMINANPADVWAFPLSSTALLPLDREFLQPLSMQPAISVPKPNGQTALVKPPMYAYKFRVTSRDRSNPKGQWWKTYNFHLIAGPGEMTEAELEAGQGAFIAMMPKPGAAGPAAAPIPAATPTPRLGNTGAGEPRFSSGIHKTPNDNARPFAPRQNAYDLSDPHDSYYEPPNMRPDGPDYGIDDPPIPF
jgi:hypothetical protein